MLSFKSYLEEAVGTGKNTHMTHLDDAVIYGGVDGARQAINALRALRDMLAGHAKGSYDVTVKWDGCVHEDTVILTNQGEMTIKQIYESSHSWDSLLIKGYDFDLNESEVWTPLFSANAESGTKDWVVVETECGSLTLTEDHEVHTSNRGWVKAKDLNPNDDITQL